MYWTGAAGLHFIRPIRWVVALLGGKPIKFTLGDAVAGNVSSGHRFLGKAKIPLSSSKDMSRSCKLNFVMVRPEDRQKKIEGELKKLASDKGLRIHEDQPPHGDGYLSERVSDGNPGRI